MGKNFKWILAIVLFPIVIFYWIIKYIVSVIKKAIIRKILAKIDINKIDTLDGWEFEELVEMIFVTLGFEVTRTPKTKDYGADLIIRYRKVTFAIQCKLYFEHTVGNSAIQEIATAREYYHTIGGVVITNSFFSKPAKKLASEVGVILLDRDSLIRILGSQNLTPFDVFDFLKLTTKTEQKLDYNQLKFIHLNKQKND